jgi:hypothetical protein
VQTRKLLAGLRYGVFASIFEFEPLPLQPIHLHFEKLFPVVKLIMRFE